MTTAAYMSGRKKWYRPQAMLWSDTPGTLVLKNPAAPSQGSIYAPSGLEKLSSKYVRSIVTESATVSSITGSGPWTATINSFPIWMGNIEVGYKFTATPGTGSVGTGGIYQVTAVHSEYSFSFTATGGTTPIAGNISNINFIFTIGPVSGSGPWLATISDIVNIENVIVGSTVTGVGVTGSFGTGNTCTVQSVDIANNRFTVLFANGTLPTSGTIKSVVVSPPQSLINDTFLILSDHNRADISVSNQRIEQKQRMVNGSMRSYHIADKINISTSWNLLPSRGFALPPLFNQTTGNSIYENYSDQIYTADGGAGGAEMLEWYENHKGPFWVFLSYDKRTNFGSEDLSSYLHLAEYSQIVQMYISSFDYSVVKRGQRNFDMWNISISLEEV